MKNLRKKIVWYFILCAFLLQVVLSVIDSTMGSFVESHASEEAVEGLSVGGFSVLFALFILPLSAARSRLLHVPEHAAFHHPIPTGLERYNNATYPPKGQRWRNHLHFR